MTLIPDKELTKPLRGSQEKDKSLDEELEEIKNP
jgi:hypothetical protein